MLAEALRGQADKGKTDLFFFFFLRWHTPAGKTEATGQ